MSSKPKFIVGEECWAHTGNESCFQRGTIERFDPHKGTINVRVAKGANVDIKEGDVHKVNAQKQDGLPDNTYLRELNEATLLHNVRHRYNDDKDDGGCYSTTGHILIAVNPFRKLKVYEESNHKRYLSQAIGSQPPHIFAVADRMYRLLVSQGESQAIIVSGPSGSGKTETCKYVLRHLAYVSKDSRAGGSTKSSHELGQLLVQTNPLLEAFGNAETVLNKNSSRFGKFVQVRRWQGREVAEAAAGRARVWRPRGRPHARGTLPLPTAGRARATTAASLTAGRAPVPARLATRSSFLARAPSWAPPSRLTCSRPRAWSRTLSTSATTTCSTSSCSAPTLRSASSTSWTPT